MSEIFISYSRKDKDFVKELHSELIKLNRDVWVDWEDIPATADWWSEIQMGIEAANNFIFVLSADSVASKVCRQEVDHAVKHNKRLIPVVRRNDFDPQLVHPEISRHNWLFATEKDDFNLFFQTLNEAIDTDSAHVHTHTRLQLKALEWDSKERNDSFLLRGIDLREACQWVSDNAEKDPKPTPLQIQYITNLSLIHI